MALHIYTAPESLQSGSDPLGQRTVELCRQNGLPCRRDYLWPNDLAQRLARFIPPGAIRRLYKYTLGPTNYWKRHLQPVQPGDVVLVDGPAIPLDLNCRMERAIKTQGAHYVYHMVDDYFHNAHPFWEKMARMRVPLADLVIAPTEKIVASARREYPEATVESYREPIDTDRLAPPPQPVTLERPTFLWAGNPHGIGVLREIHPALKILAAEHDFCLRLISGSRKPSLELPCAWEWYPFDLQREAEYSAGCIAGLAPVTMNEYGEAKGTYKIKAYMSLGIAPIATGIGIANTLIQPGQNGLLTPDNSCEAWVAALRTAFEEPEALLRMGQSGRAYVLETLSHQAVIQEWCAMFRKHFPQLNAPD